MSAVSSSSESLVRTIHKKIEVFQAGDEFTVRTTIDGRYHSGYGLGTQDWADKLAGRIAYGEPLHLVHVDLNEVVFATSHLIVLRNGHRIASRDSFGPVPTVRGAIHEDFSEVVRRLETRDGLLG